ncbi:Gustatory receptor 41e [Halyomorpha halys]|nr:Gustatory receptor 41e [Halyomorpha halys]
MFNQKYNSINDRSTSLIFFLSSVFGISPLVMTNSKFRVVYFLSCYCITAILATALLGYASKANVAQRLKNSSSEVFMLVIATANSLTHISNVYFSISTVGRLNTMLKKMRSIDKLLSKMSASDFCLRSRLDKWLEIYFIVFYWIIYGIVTGYHGIDDLFFSLSATNYSLSSAQFLIFGKYFLVRFEAIIDCLTVPQSSGYQKDLIVETLVYNRLCDAQKDMNCIYSVRFPALTLMILSYTISRLHVTYNKKDFSTMNFFYRVTFFLFYWIIFIRVIDCTAKIVHKSKQFNEILYQLMINDKKLLSNQKLQLHISMKREVVFTAGGFFNMDYTLVHSVIAAATTYVAILVQFQNSS